jgi:hypothetical protein
MYPILNILDTFEERTPFSRHCVGTARPLASVGQSVGLLFTGNRFSGQNLGNSMPVTHVFVRNESRGLIEKEFIQSSFIFKSILKVRMHIIILPE